MCGGDSDGGCGFLKIKEITICLSVVSLASLPLTGQTCLVKRCLIAFIWLNWFSCVCVSE